MKIVADTHTHSISSGHAYSTVQEMAKEALVNGIQLFALTDHGPALMGAPCLYHFGNLKILPKKIYDVRVIKGAEVNIMDYEGNLDLPESYLIKLEWAIASFHDFCIKPAGIAEHTQALINVLKNPLIDAVAHPGNPQFQVDVDKVVQAASTYHKLIEINNYSFTGRKGSEANCRLFVQKCQEYGVRMVCGSDAHISFDIGKFDHVHQVFAETGIDDKLVLNTSTEKIEAYLTERQERLKQAGFFK